MINLLAIQPVIEDSFFLFTIVIITLTLNMTGLLSKYKILLIFAVGGWITLLLAFIEFPALVIIFIGLIIFNLWFSVFGGN